MSSVDYSEIVRVLSFNASNASRSGDPSRSSPSFITTLTEAIQLVCSDEWAGRGNVLIGILRPNGTVVDAYMAQEMMAAPNFPKP